MAARGTATLRVGTLSLAHGLEPTGAIDNPLDVARSRRTLSVPGWIPISAALV